MNNELIVGLIIKSNMRVLVLMDQHAIHERIRYEELIDSKHDNKLMNLTFNITEFICRIQITKKRSVALRKIERSYRYRLTHR